MYGIDPKIKMDLVNNLEIRNTQNSDGTLVPNHTKLIITDDFVHIGSHNSYDKSHAEYTQLLAGKEFVKSLEVDYWSREWQNAEYPKKGHIIEIEDDLPEFELL